jgi:RNA polymerase sigma-70 factor (ECF subfamily)
MSYPRAAAATRPDPNLANLIAAMAAGNQEAMGQLYDLTSGLVHGVALRILENSQDAEEVVLDVYMKAWRNASTYSSDRGSVTAWLVMMTRTVAIDRIRSRNAQPRTLDLGTAMVPELASGLETPEAATVQNEWRGRIQQALNELPKEQREALLLAFFGGMSHGELAEHLGLPLGTIKTRIRLGLRRLRTLLGENTAFA